MSFVGDVNMDGKDEFAIGAPFEAGPTGQAFGQVHVYDGATGTELVVFQGNAADIGFGHSMRGVDDLDGDGVPELMIGTQRAGAVRVMSLVERAPILLIDDPEAVASFATSLGVVGFVDGDAVPDVFTAGPDPSMFGMEQDDRGKNHADESR
jgi:hypothetical protein